MSQTAPTLPPGRYRFTNVAKAEVYKILTVPSTLILLVVTVVTGFLTTGLVTNAALHHPKGYYFGFDPTQSALTGMVLVGLTGGVFGALLITAEYASGTIRTTLAAIPRRRLLLSAKVAVAAVFTVVFCEVFSFVSFFFGEAVLSGGGAPSASIGAPGALRAVTMTGLAIAFLALMSLGFGLILRSTAGAIAAYAGVVFVLPLIMHEISENAVRYLPTNILTQSLMATVNQGPVGPVGGPVSPTVGLTLMAIYAASALVAGSALFVRRDA